MPRCILPIMLHDGARISILDITPQERDAHFERNCYPRASLKLRVQENLWGRVSSRIRSAILDSHL